jgi:F420-dependent oxidoreductase-like protein
VTMGFGAAFWVQRTTWPELRDAVLHAEATGFDHAWIDDHLLNDEGDPDAPKLEGWTTLAALAAVTSRIRLGLMVAANTFRNPGLTAKIATTLDHVSGGRAILGIGAGWFEREHEAFGIEFGAGTGERLDRLGEALPLLRRLLDGERVTHSGRWYAMRDAICAPRPVQPHLPILVGGSGPRRTLPLVAAHADLWNAYGTPERIAASDAILRAACEAIGRDPEAIVRTVNANVVIRDDQAAAVAAWEGWLGRHAPEADERGRELVGTPASVVAALRRYREVGVRDTVWIFRSPFDLATMDRLPEIRAAVAADRDEPRPERTRQRPG